MDKATAERWFLGANSKRGFCSLYDGFTDSAAGDFLWVIKGGPGCGKSTLMKRIGHAAEAAGLPVEYILCSGDPDSLDGVYLPTKKTAYVDGTAPHVTEAEFPGAASKYLDMSRFLDDGALRPLLPELADLNRRYKVRYAEAYALLTAGAALLPKNAPDLPLGAEREKLDGKLKRFAARELRRLDKPGRVKRRFASAYSCQGRVTLWESLCAGDRRLVLLDNGLGLGSAALETLSALASGRGYDAVVCPDPLEPERTEALVLPEAGMAFLAADPAAELPASFPKPWRHFRLDALPDAGALAARRTELRARRRDSALMLDRALASLAEAKALHDELEALYRPHVDFGGAAALAEEHVQMLRLSENS